MRVSRTVDSVHTLTNVTTHRDGVVGRRDFLRAGVSLGFAGALPFTHLMAARAAEMRRQGTAVIMLWMQGGPSQFETFDPKPDHPNGADTETIATSVPGVSLAEGWDNVAKVMDDIALIRSVTGKEGNHQRATYQLHTGYIPSGSIKHPSLGSNLAAALGDPNFDLPHMVAIGNRVPGLGSGFLDVAYEPFQVNDATRPPDNTLVPVGRDRLERRLKLMEGLGRAGALHQADPSRVKTHRDLTRNAANLVTSQRMKAFDLDEEPDTLRDAYGRTPFGQGCLLARRLVEAGVTFVEVNLGNWDTHFDMRDPIRNLVSIADPAFAALVGDLKSKGMLERTLVVWMGEFGRTPKVNPRGGRDHFPVCFTVAMAGAGVQGGQVVGASNEGGNAVKDRPVTINDLLSTICHSVGVDPAKEAISPEGRPLKIVENGSVVSELFT